LKELYDIGTKDAREVIQNSKTGNAQQVLREGKLKGLKRMQMTN
jgi:hypothetical protein